MSGVYGPIVRKIRLPRYAHDLNYVFMANKLGVQIIINFVRGNFYLVNSTQENFHYVNGPVKISW